MNWNLNLKTPTEHFCKEEQNKLENSPLEGALAEQFADGGAQDLEWTSEQAAKSHGIYLEFNRDHRGREKDWMYMLRMTIPGGGPLNRTQWDILDTLATDYTADQEGHPSLRLTTRQNVQLHWLKKEVVPEVVQRVAESGFFSLNGCGDNVRNVMGCPLSRFSTIYNAHQHAEHFGRYFQLPLEPHMRVFGINPETAPRTPETKFDYGPSLLNRKFKIAFAAVHSDPETGLWKPDNCVECRTNDLGVAPIIRDNSVQGFQVYLGGGQGEKNGKASISTLGLPFGSIDKANLEKGLDAIVKVHQEWGDRQNRVFARLKYVIRQQGVEWFMERVRERVGDIFEQPVQNHDPGVRQLHHGWMPQANTGDWAYGMFVENGRITDGGTIHFRTLIREMLQTYDAEIMITANQDLVFCNLKEEQRSSFESDLTRFGYGTHNGTRYSSLRRHAVACVGLPTCRLSYTDSERFLPSLIDELDQRGYGNLTESIGISGCERQCSRPSTKTIGWVGNGRNRYQLLGDDNGSHQGEPLADEKGNPFLNRVPLDRVADVVEALFDLYLQKRHEDEDMGTFHRRLGSPALVSHLFQVEALQDLYKAKGIKKPE
jgi:sulfite reductase beta subunit-like hemoprotein